MDSLSQEQEKLSVKGSLSKSVGDVQKIIDLLLEARNSIASNYEGTSVTLAKLQNPVKVLFDGLKNDLKETHNGLSNYSKVMEKKFKDKPLPITDYDILTPQHALIDRAIGMHLLREGQFAVASTFLVEALAKPSDESSNRLDHDPPCDAREQGVGFESLGSENLRKQFADMYYILDELRNQRNLLPAIGWARKNSSSLEARGSNLEFELERLQFVWLFMGSLRETDQRDVTKCHERALNYARQEFIRFQTRYLREIQQLTGALAFSPNLLQSPYRQIFCSHGAWEDLATVFTREFCSLLGLSAESPLYIVSTAGAIALPTLLKLQTIMKVKRTEWTSQHELPVEIPLPPSYHFHSIFVCPVSKEQTTDANPAMMMPCGHVVAHESLMRLSKSTRFKCPYCPGESHAAEAQKVFL